MSIYNYRIICDECDEELECRTIDHSSYEDIIFVKPCKNGCGATLAVPDVATEAMQEVVEAARLEEEVNYA